MNNKLKKIELLTASIFIALVTFRLYGIPVSIFIFLCLLALNGVWIYTFICRRRTAKDTEEMLDISGKNDTIDLDHIMIRKKDYSQYKIIEHFFLAFFLWRFILNITKVHHSPALMVLSIALLAFYYFFQSIIALMMKRMNWPDSLERIFASILLIGFAFRLMHWPGANFAIVIGFSLLSMHLFILGIIYLTKAIQIRKIFTGIISLLFYIGISGLVVYILFDSMFWNGSQTMFLPHFFMSITCIVVIFLFNLKSSNTINPDLEKITNGMIRKAVVYNGIALFFFFSTMYEYYQLEYGNRPALINLRVKCQEEARSFNDLKSCFIESELFKKYEAGDYPEGE